MTDGNESRAVFERVLEALTRAEGDDKALVADFTKLDGDTRALSLIHALLRADEALRATFTTGDATRRDAALARRAALSLSISADALEATAPERNPVRLSELPLGGAVL